MGRTVVLNLPDEDYAVIEREARMSGRTPDEVLVSTIRRYASLAALQEPQAPGVEPAQISGSITAAEVEAALWKTAEELATRTDRSPSEIVAEFRAHIRANPHASMTDDERQAARGSLRRLFGSVDTGDPNSADNVRIDADLDREYGRGLDGER